MLVATVLAGCAATTPGAVPTATATASPTTPGAAPTATATASPATSPAGTPDAEAVRSEVVGSYPDTLGAEISGAAAGRTVEGLWLVDDEPGTTAVHLVGLDGTLLATVSMTGVDTVNLEDLAVGPCVAPDGTVGGRSCVHVGDIGDNVAGRGDVVLLSFPEELVAGVPVGGSVEVAPSSRRLVLAAGPVDAEALVVPADGSVVLLDKTEEEAGVHVALPGEGTLRRVVGLPLPEPRNRMLAQVAGHVATAADLSDDGRVLALRTYDQLVLLHSPDGTPLTGTTAAALPTWAVEDLGRVPGELQGESVALLADGRVVTVAEGSTAITVTTPPAR